MAYVEIWTTPVNPWVQWTTGTGACSSTNLAWNTWVDCTNASTANVTTATATASCYVWNAWHGTAIPGGQHYVAPQLSAEERAVQALRWQAEAEAQRKRADAERLKREAVERRALELLEANLDLEQRDRLRTEGHIFVCGKSGHRYRIRKGRMGNVDVIDRDGRITHRLCAHPAEQVPDYDTMLAQKLMLDSDDEGFAKVSNRQGLYSGEAAQQVMPALN